MLLFGIFLIPFLFFLIVSYAFNKSKLDTSRSELILLSLSEGLIAYLIAVLITYEGFFNVFWTYALVLLLMMVIAGLFLYYLKSMDKEWDLQIETIKNTLVLYFMTFVPFMVSLTIFRFQPLGLQIFYATLLSLLIFVLGWLIKEWIKDRYSLIFHKISNAQIFFYVGVWVVIGIFIAAWILLSFPKATLSKPLNLSDNIGYLIFDGFDTTMQNSIRSETIFKLNSDNLPVSHHDFVDYITDDEYLYLLRKDGKLYVISLNTGRVRYDRQITNEERSLNPKTAQVFFEVNGEIYLLHDHLYEISPTRHNLIDDDISRNNTQLIYKEDGLRLLHNEADNIYTLLSIDNNSLTTETQIDHLAEDESLTIISNHIFITDGVHYTLLNDDSVRFDVERGIPHYFADDNKMLYVESSYDPLSMIRGTQYKVMDIDEDSLIKDSFRQFNRHGLLIDEDLYLVPELSRPLGRVEVANADLTFKGIHQHHETERIWFLNTFNKSYVVTYRIDHDKVNYLQVDQREGASVLSLNTLEVKDLTMPLPFYSHYGLGIFVPIIIAILTPISNYRKYITVIDFKSVTERKK